MASGGAIIIIIIVILVLIGIGIGLYFFFKNNSTPPTPAPTTPAPTVTPIPFDQLRELTELSESNKPYFHNIYLDRHNVECPVFSVLNQFKLVSVADDSLIQYQYICNQAEDIGMEVNMTTSSTPNTSYGVNDLAALDIKCNKGFAISQFQLQLSGSDRENLLYKYQCSPVPNLGVCVNKTTPVVDNQEGSLISLTNLNVECNTNQVLTEVKLNTSPSGTGISYDYTCCVRI
jgi:hypothetical protein